MKVSDDQNTVTMRAVFVDDSGVTNCGSCLYDKNEALCTDAPCCARVDGKTGHFEEVNTCK